MDEKNDVISIRESDGNIVKLEVCGALESTASRAKELARDGYPDRYVVFTDKRKLGEDGSVEHGMYMSLLLRPSLFPSQAPLLGALSATAMVTALEEHTTSRLGIGWVSDVYCEGVRIGAATIEGKLDNYTTYEYIIITFAVRLDEDNFPPRLTDMVRQVFESENTSISMIIARNVLSKFFRYYSNLKTSSRFMDIYAKKFILRGVRVKYTKDQKRKTYRIAGVDGATGALVLERRGELAIHVTSPTGVQMPKRVRLKKERIPKADKKGKRDHDINNEEKA